MPRGHPPWISYWIRDHLLFLFLLMFICLGGVEGGVCPIPNTVNWQAVRILLECILVHMVFGEKWLDNRSTPLGNGESP